MEKEQILSAIKGAYANYDANAINAVANTLASSGLVTDENLADIVSKQEQTIKDFQSEIDRRVSALSIENKKLKEPKTPAVPPTEPQPKQPHTEDVPAWAKALIDANQKLQTQLQSMQGAKTRESRKEILEQKLKAVEGLPQYYSDEVLESFAGRHFTDDNAFDEFLTAKETKAKEIAQKAISESVSILSAPIVNNGTPSKGVSNAMQAYLKNKQPKQN